MDSCLPRKQVFGQRRTIDFKVASDIRENGAQCSNLERIMSRNGDVVFRTLDSGCKAQVAAGLPGDFVAVMAKQPGQLQTAKVTRQLHAEITSSLTKCRRMTLGRSFSSKWQRTASRTFFLSSSSVSASV